MNINYGANINITTQPNSQNHFIFNHTAPINLNFYKKNSLDQFPQESKDLDINNFDQDIIKHIVNMGYREDDILQHLKDVSSKVSLLYQKLIDEKVMNLNKNNDYTETGLSSLGGSLGQ